MRVSKGCQSRACQSNGVRLCRLCLAETPRQAEGREARRWEKETQESIR